jgi:hypothetical protein
MSYENLPRIWQSSELDSGLLLSRFREIKTAKVLPRKKRLVRASPCLSCYSEQIQKKVQPALSKVNIDLHLDNSFSANKQPKALQSLKKLKDEPTVKYTSSIADFMRRFEHKDSAPVRPNRRGVNGWKIVPRPMKGPKFHV